VEVTALFPELEYCLTCWKPLTRFNVIKRRWCSYPCAGMQPPHEDYTRWPRPCLTARGYPKTRFAYPDQVGATGNMHTYECNNCGRYHLGHKPIEEQRRR
jgi:hypothetical protein